MCTKVKPPPWYNKAGRGELMELLPWVFDLMQYFELEIR